MIRKGQVFEYENALYKVIEDPIITKPGKGGAFVQLVVHDIDSGRKINFKFRTEDRINIVNIFTNKATYLYNDGEIAYFTNDYEYELKKIEHSEFLSNETEENLNIYYNNQTSHDNKIVDIMTYDNRIIDVKISNELHAIVISNNGSVIKIKPIYLNDNKYEYAIKGPTFIAQNEIIVFNRETNEYIRRFDTFSKK